MEFETKAIHEGQPPDPQTGSVIAIVKGDMMSMEELITEISPEHPVLADRLTLLADEYAFEQLLHLTQP